MAGSVLVLDDIIVVDNMATEIAGMWRTWQLLRNDKLMAWEELRKYVFATDTTQTTNSTLPWKNKTTIPKLCQIRDNLYANYMSALFPKRKWVVWEAANGDSAGPEKKAAIENYMRYVLEQESVKKEIGRLVLDYIDYGNVVTGVDWVDERVDRPDGTQQTGYVGPTPKRFSPLDITFNPIADTFKRTPKIVKSLISIGELKEYLTRQSKLDNSDYQVLYDYCKDLRDNITNFDGEVQQKDVLFQVDGFQSYRQYLESGYVEVLTAYGDFYNRDKDEFLRNHVITVVDRHKLVSVKPNPSVFGYTPMYHAGWRIRQDNLWAMGPMDNLVGLQYRIDHLENLKSDVFDVIAFPLIKVKGMVEDFDWAPFERIYIQDDGDVEVLAPPFQVLQTDSQIKMLTDTMEELAGAPKEAMGFRTPGEKTAYEVQRLENAASRIFYNKILQFETEVVEPLLNAMLELARRQMDSSTIRVFDDTLNIATFQNLTAADLTGMGRIKPVAAKHFAERAELVQNITNFFNSAIGQSPSVQLHFSSVKMAKMFEEVLDLEKYALVEPYVGLAEKAEAQRLDNAHMEQVQTEQQTPAGIAGGDTTQSHMSPGAGGANGVFDPGGEPQSSVPRPFRQRPQAPIPTIPPGA